jgi:hypothetical protein
MLPIEPKYDVISGCYAGSTEDQVSDGGIHADMDGPFHGVC